MLIVGLGASGAVDQWLVSGHICNDCKKKKEVIDNVFEHRGVKYGIEICNDHSTGGKVDQTVDVHIVFLVVRLFKKSESNAARIGSSD